MKTLLPILAIAILLSCDNKNCDSIHENYSKALQNAATPEALNEIKRQYNELLANSDC